MNRTLKKTVRFDELAFFLTRTDHQSHLKPSAWTDFAQKKKWCFFQHWNPHDLLTPNPTPSTPGPCPDKQHIHFLVHKICNVPDLQLHSPSQGSWDHSSIGPQDFCHRNTSSLQPSHPKHLGGGEGNDVFLEAIWIMEDSKGPWDPRPGKPKVSHKRNFMAFFKGKSLKICLTWEENKKHYKLALGAGVNRCH